MLAFGFSALYLNPRRPTNHVLAAIAFVSTAVFAVQLVAKFLGARYAMNPSSNPLPWIGLKFSLIALITPFLVWLCYYIVSGQYASRRKLIGKIAPLGLLSLFLAYWPLTEGFKPRDSLPGNVRHGPLYLLYFLPMLASQVAVCICSLAASRRLTGDRRLEFQFIAVALGYLSLLAVLVETAHATWPQHPVIGGITRLLSFLVYIAFCICPWSVTVRRVYDSGQVWLSVAKRILVIAGIGFAAVLTIQLIPESERSPLAVATVVGAALLAFHHSDDKVREWLRLSQTRPAHHR